MLKCSTDLSDDIFRNEGNGQCRCVHPLNSLAMTKLDRWRAQSPRKVVRGHHAGSLVLFECWHRWMHTYETKFLPCRGSTMRTLSVVFKHQANEPSIDAGSLVEIYGEKTVRSLDAREPQNGRDRISCTDVMTAETEREETAIAGTVERRPRNS